MSYFQEKQDLLEMLERESDPFVIEDVSKMVRYALAIPGRISSAVNAISSSDEEEGVTEM